MQSGKVSGNVLKRSVIKPILGRPQGLPGGGLDGSVFSSEKDGVFVISSNPVNVSGESGCYYGVHRCLADLYAAGATPIGIEDVILLPADAEESTLQQLTGVLAAACRDVGAEILGGHTTVTAAVNRPIMTLTAVGRMEAEGKLQGSDYDLVVTKAIGLAGTALLAEERETELRSRYTIDFIERAKRLGAEIVTGEEITVCRRHGAVLHNLSEGGVLAGLWEFLEHVGLGMDIDMKKIPICQETVELTEFFGLNPYQMLSTGSYLAAVQDGQALVEELEQIGVPAVVIGKTIADKARIIRRDEEVRYLDRPAADELYKAGLLF